MVDLWMISHTLIALSLLRELSEVDIIFVGHFARWITCGRGTVRWSS